MFAWQSLDRQTLAWYGWYECIAYKGWVVSLIAPDQYFGGNKLHKTEEDAANHVKSLYEQFVELQKAKAASSIAERPILCNTATA